METKTVSEVDFRKAFQTIIDAFQDPNASSIVSVNAITVIRDSGKVETFSIRESDKESKNKMLEFFGGPHDDNRCRRLPDGSTWCPHHH